MYAYEWSDVSNGFNLKCLNAMADETVQNKYQKYSFVNIGDEGTLIKVEGTDRFYHYKCDPTTGTFATVDEITSVTMGAITCGDGSFTGADVTTLVLKQVRDDPQAYAANNYVQQVNQIYGIVTDQCIFKVDATGTTLTATELVLDLHAASTRAYRQYSSLPEHIDITSKHLAIMSPVQCDPNADNTGQVYVTNPSVDVYTFSSTTWTCIDLPDSDVGTQAWTLPLVT